ncbi:PilZ domain-containing protein [Gimesia aquarii]|uniref:Uncharacterized protein n=1 Tax=Gimesia aquarii TaxID=2527964 RepID=A0A517WXT0_9PLAN|nr:PilZ domain-containing protein [Gimesia aquarii]QDU10059.1 hypothetical protein V202x_34570 [Gimesia aquarii]
MQTLNPSIQDIKVATSKSQQQAVERIFSLLDKIEQKNLIQFASQRSHTRKTFRGTLSILLPTENPVLDLCDTEAINVQGLSISQSGVSFLFAGDIDRKDILVGLTVLDDKVIWFHSEIVRKKQFPEADFWEYGVKFLRKVNE